ncbi:tail component [Escherichia coli]|uniref:Tail component n=1 Tax=Escherichia coli TaxID=562 RepID=A0A376YE71_ECOLX|nr:tail component [Escherichia coli]
MICPWWLVCRGTIHKFRCVPHLTGRRFEHGVTDCYTLFRDAYHLAGIEMPDFHREDDWWRNGQNLYLDNLEATGLYQVPLSAATAGRCAAVLFWFIGAESRRNLLRRRRAAAPYS